MRHFYSESAAEQNNYPAEGFGGVESNGLTYAGPTKFVIKNIGFLELSTSVLVQLEFETLKLFCSKKTFFYIK